MNKFLIFTLSSLVLVCAFSFFVNLELSRSTVEVNDISMSQMNATECPEIKEQLKPIPDPNPSSQFSELPSRQDEDICSPLPYTLPPITVQWRKNLRKIFDASLKVIPTGDDNMQSWIALLLDHLTPIQLLQSTQNLPNMEDIRPIVEKLHNRYQYHIQNDYILEYKENSKRIYDEKKQRESEIPPPVTMLVFGGSITAGTLCRFNPLDISQSPPRKRCAWPFRLEHFLNTMLGFDAIYVLNEATGGTNTELASQRYEYGLLPESMPQPDIVINSYSSNDMHILSMEQAKSMNITLYEAVRDSMQDFMRQVQGSHQECKHGSNLGTDNESKKYYHRNPLIIYLDDYLGNEQDDIVETMAFTSAMKTITQYYQIMSISYADAIRHIVYANTKETWFSPNWYEKDEFVRQVHPTIGGHLAIMWVIAFNMWNAMSTFCNEESALIHLEPFAQNVKKNAEDENIEYRYIGGIDMPQITLDKPIPGWPSPIPKGLIPELTPDLKLYEVSEKWKKSSNEYTSKCNDMTNMDHSQKEERPCPFAWISSIDGMNVDDLNKKMNEVLLSNNGWEAFVDYDKLGYVPNKDHSELPQFTMEIKNISKPIQNINLLTMRSYGERWEGSRILVQIHRINDYEQSDEVVQEVELVGFHSSETSVTYSNSISIDEGTTKAGDTIHLIITLVGGSTFKFTGMSICYK